MTADLTLYELPPSPNNVRVRLALKVKKLPYQGVTVDPADRSKVVEVSGQPLTPVLKHKDAVIFDSGAIVRYIDANFRDMGPRLFSESRDEMRAIERWENHARSGLGQPIGMLFDQAFSKTPDGEVIRRANEAFHAATADLEAALESADWLAAGRITAADLFCAPIVRLALLTDEDAASARPIGQFFRDNLHLGDSRPRTQAWVERVMLHDI